MSNQIYLHIHVSGPAKSVTAWSERMVAARQTFSDGTGSHWGEALGLFDAHHTIAPRLNDDRLAANPPPGEAYATLSAFWLGRHWTATEVGLAFGTIASLFPDLTIHFNGEHYEEKGMRGLWSGGDCIVFDVFEVHDNGDQLESVNVDRRVLAQRIPDYYAPFFASADLPTWEEMRAQVDSKKANPPF